MLAALNLHRWLGSLVATVALLCLSSPASADPGTITLKTGEELEVEVTDLQFGRFVNVKFEDGTVRTVQWEEIEDLKMGTDTEAPVTLDEAAVTAAPAAPAAPTPPAPTPTAPPPKPTGPSKYEQLQLVEKELDDLEEDMPGIGGGIALTAVGFGGGLIILAHASAASSACSACDFTPNYAIGVSGLVLGVIGIVVLGSQGKKRTPYQEKIGRLEGERDRLRLDLKGDATGAVAGLTLQF